MVKNWHRARVCVGHSGGCDLKRSPSRELLKFAPDAASFANIGTHIRVFVVCGCVFGWKPNQTTLLIYIKLNIVFLTFPWNLR